jgi:small redox-active disulfide protein 2
MPLIQVLGPGCQKCQVLYERAREAARELGLECEIEKVSDMQAIIGFGVMSTPALVVDGAVKFSGRVPTVEQLKEILT